MKTEMAYLYITYGRTDHIYSVVGWKSSQFMQNYINNFMGSSSTLIILLFEEG